jgi:hypothetical protein
VGYVNVEGYVCLVFKENMSENSKESRSMITKTFNKKEWRRRKYSNKYKGKLHRIVSKH